MSDDLVAGVAGRIDMDVNPAIQSLKSLEAQADATSARLQQLSAQAAAAFSNSAAKALSSQIAATQAQATRLTALAQGLNQGLQNQQVAFQQWTVNQQAVHNQQILGMQQTQAQQLLTLQAQTQNAQAKLQRANNPSQADPQGFDFQRRGLSYIGSTMVFSGAVMAARELLGVIQEDERATTDLVRALGQPVDAGMMSQERIALMKEFGQSIKDVAEAQIFAAHETKNLGEVQEATKTIVMGVNLVGKDATTIGKDLLAIQKDYGLSLADQQGILDKVVGVSQTYASVNRGDLLPALASVSEQAVAMKIPLNLLIGFIQTGAEATGRSAETAANAIRLMAGRLEDSKVIEKLANFGINAKNAEGQLRPFGDTIQDISAKWSQWSEVEQGEILTAIAGARQKQFGLALIQQYGNALNVAKTASESQGAAEAANQLVMQTSQKQLEQLKAAWTELALEVGKAGFLDAFKGIANDITALVGVFMSIPAPVRQAILTVAELGAAIGVVNLAVKTFTGTALTGMIAKYAEAQIATMGLAASTTTLGAVLDVVANNPYLVLLSAISAVVVAMQLFHTETDNSINQMGDQIRRNDEQANSFNKLLAEYDDLKAKIAPTVTEKQRLVDVTKQIAELAPQAADGVNRETGEIAILRDRAKEAAIELEKMNEQQKEALRIQLGSKLDELRQQRNDEAAAQEAWIARMHEMAAEIEYLKSGQEKMIDSNTGVDVTKEAIAGMQHNMDAASKSLNDHEKAWDKVNKQLAQYDALTRNLNPIFGPPIPPGFDQSGVQHDDQSQAAMQKSLADEMHTIELVRANVKELDAEYKHHADDTGYLAQRHRLLTDELDANKRAQTSLIAILLAAKTAMGDHSKVIQKAESDLAKLRIEAAQTENALSGGSTSAETALEKALRGAMHAMQMVESQGRILDAQYKHNSASTEYLTEKESVLNNELEANLAAQGAVNQILADAHAATGDVSKATQKAESDLARLREQYAQLAAQQVELIWKRQDAALQPLLESYKQVDAQGKAIARTYRSHKDSIEALNAEQGNLNDKLIDAQNIAAAVQGFIQNLSGDEDANHSQVVKLTADYDKWSGTVADLKAQLEDLQLARFNAELTEMQRILGGIERVFNFGKDLRARMIDEMGGERTARPFLLQQDRAQVDTAQRAIDEAQAELAKATSSGDEKLISKAQTDLERAMKLHQEAVKLLHEDEGKAASADRLAPLDDQTKALQRQEKAIQALHKTEAERLLYLPQLIGNLTAQMDANHAKEEVLSDAIAQATQRYGENSDAVRKLKDDLAALQDQDIDLKVKIQDASDSEVNAVIKQAQAIDKLRETADLSQLHDQFYGVAGAADKARASFDALVKSGKSIGDATRQVVSNMHDEIDALDAMKRAATEAYDAQIAGVNARLDALKKEEDAAHQSDKLSDENKKMQELMREKADIEKNHLVQVLDENGVARWVADPQKMFDINKRIADQQLTMSRTERDDAFAHQRQVLEDQKKGYEEQKKALDQYLTDQKTTQVKAYDEQKKRHEAAWKELIDGEPSHFKDWADIINKKGFPQMESALDNLLKMYHQKAAEAAAIIIAPTMSQLQFPSAPSVPKSPAAKPSSPSSGTSGAPATTSGGGSSGTTSGDNSGGVVVAHVHVQGQFGQVLDILTRRGAR